MTEPRTMTNEAARSIGMPYRDDATLFDNGPPKPANRVVVSLSDAGACLSIYAPDSAMALAEAILNEGQCLALVQRLLRVLQDIKQ
jgi:hypothetical protein